MTSYIIWFLQLYSNYELYIVPFLPNGILAKYFLIAALGLQRECSRKTVIKHKWKGDLLSIQIARVQEVLITILCNRLAVKQRSLQYLLI